MNTSRRVIPAWMFSLGNSCRLVVQSITPWFGLLLIACGFANPPLATPGVRIGFDDNHKEERQAPGSLFDRWLDDVFYIITDSERAEFKGLRNDRERQKFVEEFWQRRNPEPSSLKNKFKERYYLNLAYVKAHYAYLKAGRLDDRARIYIVFGPPDKIQKPRPQSPEELPVSRGASPTARVVERWVYGFIEGIGNDVPVEFADPSKTGEYRVIVDPLSLIDRTPNT